MGFASRSPGTRLVGVLVATVALLMMLVLNFHRPTPAYNAWVAEVILVIAGSSVLIGLRARHATERSISPAAVWLIVGMLMSMALSTALSDHPYESWRRLELYLAAGCLVGAVWLWAADEAAELLIPVFAGVALVHAYFLVELLHSIYVQGPRIGRQTVATNYFAHIRHFGYLGFLSACAGTGMAVLGRGHWRWLGAILGTLALYGLIQFGSRGAFLAWCLFVGLVAVVLPGRVRLVGSAIVAAGIAAAIVGQVDARYPFPNKKQQSVFVRQASGEDQWGTARGRIGVWEDSWQEIVKRPWLGHGPDGYVLSKCCLKGSVQPHNALIQMLFEFGFLGAMGILTAFAAYLRLPWARFREGWRSGAPDATLAVLLSLSVSFLAFALIDGLLYHAIPMLLFSLFLGILGAMVRERTRPGTGS